MRSISGRRNHRVTGGSPLSTLIGFHPVTSLPNDIMHDYAEGVCPLIIVALLKKASTKRLFSYRQVEERISTFEYGTNDATNTPPAIRAKHLAKHSIVGSASQKLCLFRLFPIIFFDIIEHLEKFELYVVLREIINYVFALPFRRSWLAYLNTLTTRFQCLMIHHLPDRVIPKIHFTTDYSRLIDMHGPPIREYYHVIDESSCTTSVKINQLCHEIQVLLSENNRDLNGETTILEYKTLIHEHVTYSKGSVFVVKIDHEEEVPCFVHLLHIFKIDNTWKLIVEHLHTVAFGESLWAYEIEQTSALCSMDPNELISLLPKALDIYFLKEQIDTNKQEINRIYSLPVLPEKVQLAIDAKQTQTFRGHTNHRRLLLDAIYNDLTKKYALLYPSSFDYKIVAQAIPAALGIESTNKSGLGYINENDDGDVEELEMVKKMKEMLQIENPDVQQLILYWRKTFQLKRLFIRNIEEHSIEAVLDEYRGFKQPFLIFQEIKMANNVDVEENVQKLATDLLPKLPNNSDFLTVQALGLLLSLYNIFEIKLGAHNRAVHLLYGIVFQDPGVLTKPLRMELKSWKFDIKTKPKRRPDESASTQLQRKTRRFEEEGDDINEWGDLNNTQNVSSATQRTRMHCSPPPLPSITTEEEKGKNEAVLLPSLSPQHIINVHTSNNTESQLAANEEVNETINVEPLLSNALVTTQNDSPEKCAANNERSRSEPSRISRRLQTIIDRSKFSTIDQLEDDQSTTKTVELTKDDKQTVTKGRKRKVPVPPVTERQLRGRKLRKT
ncbi:unnamed protein product [Didymodactylos carnosus]|uniref:Uncharacterized protein n=1 Tax=Didymodactylos carnosus TaxID=1234261 RepID=A0A8S2H6T9_9BILA|nr:unnamed protein product [Didymodactylos carnosus]CAF3608903.1 unnamed protein product [Didymodactylos carnosus]